MTRDKLCFPVGKERSGRVEKFARNIFRCGRNRGERRIILVEKPVIEPLVQDLPDALLDFADVHQHAGHGIDRAGKDEVSDVVSPGAVTRGSLGTKRRQILAVAPLLYEQPPRSREFEPLADRQEHAVACR